MTAFGRSEELWERACQVIPLGTQTMSKSPTQWVRGVHPLYLQRGRGSHVWDVDGNEFVDFPMALGPVILGYAEPEVDEAVRRQMADGMTFTLMHPLEVEVAERIVRLCPGVEAVRFGKSGSDVLAAAVRAARAITGRDRVLVSGYHGWQDWYIGSTSWSLGVPKMARDLVNVVPFNDLDALDQALEGPDAPAAVVIEPSAAEVPLPGYLRAATALARSHSALMIFDEVITGFRLGLGGARERYGVIPDLSCYGKALGNGMPISAVGGRWEIMTVFEDIFFSGTHGGETLSLAAAACVLDRLASGHVLPRIHGLGQRMLDGINELIAVHNVGARVRVGGEPERAVVGFSGKDHLANKSWVQQCMAEEGVLFNGSMFICARHDEADIDRALRGFDRAFVQLEDGRDIVHLLKGAPVQPVFRAP